MNNLSGIKSFDDPELKKIAKEAPEGVNPYYHAIGTLGGAAVRDRYSDKNSELYQNR